MRDLRRTRDLAAVPPHEPSELGRRFVISIGAGAFEHPEIEPLPNAVHDAERLCGLLEPLGYRRVLAEVSDCPTAQVLRTAIGDWAERADLGPRDVVVVYFAGHGHKAADRHYLLCHDSRPGRPNTALATEDLCRELVLAPLGHLLVILDVCYAEAGSVHIASLAGSLAAVRQDASSLVTLAAARYRQRADDGAFLEALSQVFAQPRAGALQKYLSVQEVTSRVNAYFDAHPIAQRASCSHIASRGVDRFFPDPAYPPAGWDGIDLEELARLRAQVRAYFEPRARGLDHLGEKGDYFTARTTALGEIGAWLTGPHDQRARVVTGNPGSGKSALLGRVLQAFGEDGSAQRTPPSGETLHADRVTRLTIPRGMPVAPLLARRATVQDLAAELARALRLPATGNEGVLEALGNRIDPIVILVDALDEAGTVGDAREGARIARSLLQPLSVLPAVRLIIATRRHLAPAIGRAVQIIDLDSPAYIKVGDIHEYARALLLDEQNPDSHSPYRGRPQAADLVAQGIAQQAGTSFLVARMTVRALIHGQTLVDVTDLGWKRHLPTDAGEAFTADLDRFGGDRTRVERLLRPLAYAQGPGLPWSTIWAPLATALSGVTCTEEDLLWLHEHASAYLVETTTPVGESAFRLFHETMAEHLRTGGRDRDAHNTITEVLLARVPRDPSTAQRDWRGAHWYIREHLVTHAAAARPGTLDHVIDDPAFLVYAAPTPLLRALPAVKTAAGHAIAALYRTSPHAGLDAEQRRQVLAVDAARRHHPFMEALAVPLVWKPRWATGTQLHPAQRIVLTGHTDAVSAVACIKIDDRPHAITTSNDHTVRVWDLTDGTERALLTDDALTSLAVACTMIDDRPHAITTSNDHTVRVWDLTDGTQRSTLIGHTSAVTAVACTTIDSRPHAITSDDSMVRVWDLTNGTQRSTLTGHTNTVTAVACTTINGRPHAVTTSYDMTVRMWDLIDGTERATLSGHTHWTTSVACTTINGRPHAVTTSYDMTVRIWDLTNGTEHATLTGHSRWATAVACTVIDDRPHAVIGDDTALRVWDVADAKERSTPTAHASIVTAVACITIDNRPHAVTTGNDHMARVWDLTEAAERTTPAGHTSTVTAMACTTIDARPHIVTSSNDRTVRAWDLDNGSERTTLTGHVSWVTAVACTTIDKRPHAITTSYDHMVRVWNLADGRERTTLAGHTSWVTAGACTVIDGRPHAVTSGYDRTLRVWDLTTGLERTTLASHAHWATALACTSIEDRPHAVTTSFDHMVRVWDLADGRERATLAGHTDGVTAVSCTAINGRPYAVTGSNDHTVRVWDLIDGREHATLTGHTDDVTAVACTTIDERPHAVTSSNDCTVRVWDLTLTRQVHVLALPAQVQALTVVDDVIAIGVDQEVVVLTRR